jgi:hypothetical protein
VSQTLRAELDQLLLRAALVVEGDDILGGARHVRHDDSDADKVRSPQDCGK